MLYVRNSSVFDSLRRCYITIHSPAIVVLFCGKFKQARTSLNEAFAAVNVVCNPSVPLCQNAI